MAITTDGLGRLLRLIEDDGPYGALGSGSAVVTASDNELDDEEVRESATSILVAGSIAQIRVLFSNTEIPANVEELGLFLNASSTADSGDLLVRVLESFTPGTADFLITFEIEVLAS